MRYLAILFLITTVDLFAQSFKELYPTLGDLVDKSPEKEEEFNRQKQACETVWGRRFNELTDEEKKDT